MNICITLPQRKSPRLNGWNYRSEGYNYVTICTKNQWEYFGEVRNGIMGLNELGCFVAKFWQEIPQHFSHVMLDEWIVMPNHVHGILFLKKKNRTDVALNCTDVALNRTDVALQRPYDNNHFSKISPKSGSLSTIIRSFKAICTRTIHDTPNGSSDFVWHNRFHDHIIRNEDDLNRIRQYIRDNPAMWHRDRNNPRADGNIS